MALNRTFSLFYTLNKKDKLFLDFVIKNKAKTRTKELHEIIINKKNKSVLKDKEILFEKLFGKKYNVKKDYLLRNEIRIYNRLLKEVIVTSSISSKRIEFDFVYFDQLVERGLYDIFESEINSFIKNHLKKENYDFVFKALEKKIRINLNEKKYDSLHFKKIQESLSLCELTLLKSLNDSYSTIKKDYIYTERVLNQILRTDNELSKVNFKLNLQDDHILTDYANMQYLFSKSHLFKGNERIKILMKILALLDNTKNSKINVSEKKFTVLHDIALSHLLMANYQKSIDFFEKCIEYNEYISEQNFNFFLFNYLSALVKSKNFEKALLLIKQYKSHFENLTLINRSRPFMISTYILCGEIEEAQKLFPNNFKEDDIDTYHYYRTVQIIVHFENNNIELAQIEATNFKKHLYKYYKDITDENFNYILLKILIKFIDIQFNNINSELIQKCKKLSIDFEEVKAQLSYYSKASIEVVWLDKKLKEYS